MTLVKLVRNIGIASFIEIELVLLKLFQCKYKLYEFFSKGYVMTWVTWK